MDGLYNRLIPAQRTWPDKVIFHPRTDGPNRDISVAIGPLKSLILFSYYVCMGHTDNTLNYCSVTA